MTRSPTITAIPARPSSRTSSIFEDGDELAAFEAEVSDTRADEAAPAGNLDFKHFKAIHRHLFQDVYDWAGEIRTVRMSKGGNMFCFPENIENQAKNLFGQN